MAIDLMQEVERIDREVQRLKARLEPEETGMDAFFRWVRVQYAWHIPEADRKCPRIYEGHMREYLKERGWEYIEGDEGWRKVKKGPHGRMTFTYLEDLGPYDYEKMIDWIGP